MNSATPLEAGMPKTHLSPTLSGGWDGSVASARRAVSLAGISVLVETSSLFLMTGNVSLRLRKGFGISALDPRGGSSFEGFPCIFPVDQGSDSRDEFAIDSTHRHLVCCCRDSAPPRRHIPRTLRDSTGSWARRVRETEPETGGFGPGRRPAPVYLCRRVRRFGFAVHSPTGGLTPFPLSVGSTVHEFWPATGPR
jgi:hypothetical protein